jgi:hypothetical protein
LADLFDERPITEQNLSDWKQGGFLDWQRNQEARSLVREFLSQAEEVGEETGGDALLDRVSNIVAVVLLRLFREAAQAESGPTQRRAVLELARELARLRRVDHQRQRVRLLEEQQRRQMPSGYEIARVKRMEAQEETEKSQEKLLHFAESLRSEYITGLEDGTLTPERKAWIEEYFECHAAEIEDACGTSLPGEDEEEEDEEQEPEAQVEAEIATPPVKRKGRNKARPAVPESGGGEAPDPV